MAKGGIAYTLNKAKLDEITREHKGRAGDFLYIVAAKCEETIKRDMNSQSPSPAGETPGIDTGALVNSIIAEKVSDEKSVLSDGASNYGGYGVNLEYGTVKMAARPFFLVGIEKTIAALPDGLIEKVVE